MARMTYGSLARRAGRDPPWRDLVLLSTCNRVEAYALTERPRRTEDALHRAFGLPVGSSALYRLEGVEAAAHLLRVASGLDSVAIGERQVAQQVRAAIASRPEGLLSSRDLDALFVHAARASSRIRVLADLRTASASASDAAVRYVREAVGLVRPKVALIGSGKMARLAASSLGGRAEITVLDRNPAKATGVAARLGGTPLDLSALPGVLERVDVAIAATSAPTPLLGPRALGEILRRRRGRRLWIVDLGVPRNVDGRMTRHEGLTYVDIDGLAPWAGGPPNPMALARAETRIHREARAALASLVGDGWDAIGSWRRAVEGFRLEEVERALARLPTATDAERAVLDRLSTRLVNRLLHSPTERLREIRAEEREAVLRTFVESLRDPGGEGA